jgi:eukaryotic-like serine/threonine-protein kinase
VFEGALGSQLNNLPISPVPYRFDIGDYVDGKYFVRSFIGRGGMGDVLRVQDHQTNHTFALKYCRDAKSRQRFAREVRIMEKISSKHVIPIIDANLRFDPPYFVMPLGERSLDNDIEKLKGNEGAVLDIFGQICAGVKDIHDHGVFHRDLKPANVLRLTDGTVIVSDLGLATFEDRDTSILTSAIQQIGTEDYLAPEQRQTGGGAEADIRTDVYQLGKLLYCLITGCTPRWVEFAKLSPGLAHIIRRATSENPEGRYQNVATLMSALNIYRASQDSKQNPREALDNLIRMLESEYPRAVPPNDRLNQIMEVLSYASWLERVLVIECFHRVPVSWLPSIAKAFDPMLQPLMLTYATSIQNIVGGYNFPFADDVAERMKMIYEHSEAIPTRVLALRALMTSADKLGRYAPQSTFCNYLKSVTTIELGLPIAEMIAEHAAISVREFRGYNAQVYHPAIQSALAGLRKGVAELDQGARRRADLKIVAQLYEHLARPLVNLFLKEALEDRIHHEILTEIDPSADKVNSLSFRLYDKKLLELFRSFFHEWILACSASEGIYHDYENSGVATLPAASTSSGTLMERRDRFHGHIVRAGTAFSELNTYVQRAFPQFDMEESDKVGVARFEKWQDEVDRQVGDILHSTRNHSRVSKDIDLNDYV